MAKIIEHKRFENHKDNASKFWEYDLDNKGTIHIRYGKIGFTPRYDEKQTPSYYLQNKIAEKLKKGYKQVF